MKKLPKPRKECLNCKKIFYPRLYQIKIGDGRYCSRNCGRTSPKNRGENCYRWVGDKIGYFGIHNWLKKEFGNADKCENPNCLKRSKIFQWAKLKDKEYERKRENFWMLCASCHNSYDMTKERRLKISNTLKKIYATA